jgi:ankyrin repeat protein
VERDLHWLAESGQVSLLRDAIAQGADPNVRDDEGRTPLHVAVRRRRVDVVRALADLGANLAEVENARPGYSALHLSCLAPAENPAAAVPMIELLLDLPGSAEPRDQRGVTPLHLALGWCDVAMLHRFLEKGVDVNAADADGVTPLHVACRRGAVVPADVFIGDDVALDASSSAGAREDTALERLENESVVQALLEAGALAEVPDREGRTPLHVAAACGSHRAMKLLLDAGAKADTQDAWGSAPLHLATDAVAAEILLRAGAARDATDAERRTPLHQAVAGGHDEVVDLLLDKGSSTSAPDRDGRTPLHLAAAAGRALTVEKLLEHGANPAARDADGRSPLAWAELAGHTHVVAALKRRGAKR